MASHTITDADPATNEAHRIWSSFVTGHQPASMDADSKNSAGIR
jgi:hypothetical protein